MRLHYSSIMAGVAVVLLCSSAAHAKTAEYSLNIARTMVNITGTPTEKITVNGQLPAPTLRFTQGDDAVIHVTNTLSEPTSVHWHGLILPGAMDGVTGFNGYQAIPAGQTFTYRFPIKQSGTYWYHSHTGGQEQDGLYGSIIAHPQGTDPIAANRDYVVVLSDFTPQSAHNILANLKMSSDYYANARFTLHDFFNDWNVQGFDTAWKDVTSWGNMRMMRTDLADVTGYTFLINGQSPQQNWTGLFKVGETVRLRFINASAMSFFDVRIPGLTMRVVQADGQAVEPVAVDEFRFAPAETYDVLVTPTADKPYTIAAEPLDRSGFALGTLATRTGQRGDTPTQRPRAQLTMADMDMEQMMKDDPDMEMTEADMVSGWAKTGTPAGQKALSYADLRYAGVQSDTRAAQRTIDVRLGGNMERYIWTINDKKFSEAEPIRLTYGERVRLKFTNETMMAHPMHLHGMFVQLENGQPAAKLPNKHTVIVPPGGSYSVLLTADEVGEWAFHCHLLYHMASGMMRQVVVAKLDAADVPNNHAAHADMAAEHGGGVAHMMRLETAVGSNTHGTQQQSWDLDGWIGTDENKLWLKSEGERTHNSLESAEVWALYSRNISTFWDAQAGLRYDIKPHATAYATIGVNGLAPYWFETEAHLFVSQHGLIGARLRQENDLFLTQQLVLQPYGQVNLWAQDDKRQQTGAGLTDGQLGLQTRYQLLPKLAPYIDVHYSRKFGETSAIAKHHGDNIDEWVGAIGLRLMF